MSNANEQASPEPSANARANGAPVQSGISSGERHLLTALSYDIVGSTQLLAHSDPDDFHDFISEFQREVKNAISSRGGRVSVELGDGGLAIFPIDIDAKDAASAAINAGLEVVRVTSTLKARKGFPQFSVRIGVATSIAAIHGDGRGKDASEVTALSLALATRLQNLAEPGSVLVSQQTKSLARRSHRFSFLGSRNLKGFSEPENVWRAISRKYDFERYLAFGRVNSAMVDRASELRQIVELWRNVVAGHGEVVVLEGEAGIGKSRMLHEIRKVTRAERRRMLLLQCLPSGSRSSLSPLQLNSVEFGAAHPGDPSRADVAEMFAQHGIHDNAVVDVFSFLAGVKDTITDRLREASFEVIQAKLAEAAWQSAKEFSAAGPALVAVEDAHWIDPTSLRLLLKVAESLSQLPILLVITTRAPAAAALMSLPNVHHLVLGRLDVTDARTVIQAKLPTARSPETSELLDFVEHISGGIPLLIEEICEWAASSPSDAARRFSDPEGESSAVILESVLDARLERLGAAKNVIRAAAVAGTIFSASLLHEIIPEIGEQTVDNALNSLIDAGLVIRARSTDAVPFGFRHGLIQESLYGSLFRKARQTFHRRLYAAVHRDRSIASWIDDAALAEHAEKAGMPKEAIELLIAAGKDSSARSSMTEARWLLEHAVSLVESLPDSDLRNELHLSVLTALGPAVIATAGPGSFEARKLYETGIALARLRPAVEQARWFPIYWGWWFTGAGAENGRAREILHDLRDVSDPEVQLQIRHCNWAIDFYLGQHENCLANVASGLPYYGEERARLGRTLFGGHDARVCALCHRSLSLWFTGKVTGALRAIEEARHLALETRHVGSIVHAKLNEAMLYCYRRDFASLQATIVAMRQLAEANSLAALASTAEIYEGWLTGIEGDPARGLELIKRGMAVQLELQTPEDYAVYCDMQAELLGLAGDFPGGLDILQQAIPKTEDSQYRYWLPALYYRRALLMAGQGSHQSEAEEALTQSLTAATAQHAVALQLSAYETASWLSPALASRFRNAIELARSGIDADEPIFVNPPQPGRRSSSAIRT